MSFRFFRMFSYATVLISSVLCGQEVPQTNESAEKNDKNLNSPSVQSPVQPPRIGNFSLPVSQQPAALVGFGGNIIRKGEIQPYFFADAFIGKKRVISDAIPSLLFGITDDLSIYFNFPVAPVLRDGHHWSHGLEDFFVQLEYAFYSKKTYWYEDQATIVGNIAVPTGSVRKDPNTGFGAPSFFIGATYYRTTVDWVFFLAPGAIVTTSNHRTKIGDQFLYQCGVSRYLPSPRGWIYALMFEVDGQYNRKNIIHGETDSNSGGNFILATPSIWISSKHMLLQLGVSLPVEQNLFGHQHKIDYGFFFNFAWSFYPEEL